MKSVNLQPKLRKLRQLAAKVAEAQSQATSARVEARVARLAARTAKKLFREAKRRARDAAEQAKFAQRKLKAATAKAGGGGVFPATLTMSVGKKRSVHPFGFTVGNRRARTGEKPSEIARKTAEALAGKNPARARFARPGTRRLARYDAEATWFFLYLMNDNGSR